MSSRDPDDRLYLEHEVATFLAFLRRRTEACTYDDAFFFGGIPRNRLKLLIFSLIDDGFISVLRVSVRRGAWPLVSIVILSFLVGCVLFILL